MARILRTEEYKRGALRRSRKLLLVVGIVFASGFVIHFVSKTQGREATSSEPPRIGNVSRTPVDAPAPPKSAQFAIGGSKAVSVAGTASETSNITTPSSPAAKDNPYIRLPPAQIIEQGGALDKRLTEAPGLF